MNETPESDVFKQVVKGDAWLCMTGLEKRAVQAEEKLKTAKDIITAAARAAKAQGLAEFAKAIEKAKEDLND
jgi:hypothetical protein